jgi:arylsulfatase A-like enzyme
VLDELDLSNTYVLILADHGETLGERFHKLDHGAQVFDEQIRIPAILSGPGLAAQRVSAPVETIDFAPTLAGLLGLKAADDVVYSGVDLSPFLSRATAPEWQRDFVFSSARADQQRHADRGYQLVSLRRVFSVRSESWKLILYPGKQQDYLELYDLAMDPGETVNVLTLQEGSQAASNSARSRELVMVLEQWNSRLREPIGVVDVSAELAEQLRALGYLD